MMLFQSNDERSEFFSRAEHDLSMVNYGMAMDHAASTHTGVWGDTSRLEIDCARIMRLELMKFGAEKSVESAFDYNDIRHSAAFQMAWNKARSGPDSDTGAIMEVLGVRDHNMNRRLSPEAAALDLTKVHETIYNELCGSLPNVEDRIWQGLEEAMIATKSLRRTRDLDARSSIMREISSHLKRVQRLLPS